MTINITAMEQKGICIFGLAFLFQRFPFPMIMRSCRTGDEFKVSKSGTGRRKIFKQQKVLFCGLRRATSNKARRLLTLSWIGRVTSSRNTNRGYETPGDFCGADIPQPKNKLSQCPNQPPQAATAVDWRWAIRISSRSASVLQSGQLTVGSRQCARWVSSAASATAHRHSYS